MSIQSLNGRVRTYGNRLHISDIPATPLTYITNPGTMFPTGGRFAFGSTKFFSLLFDPADGTGPWRYDAVASGDLYEVAFGTASVTDKIYTYKDGSTASRTVSFTVDVNKANMDFILIGVDGPLQALNWRFKQFPGLVDIQSYINNITSINSDDLVACQNLSVLGFNFYRGIIPVVITSSALRTLQLGFIEPLLTYTYCNYDLVPNMPNLISLQAQISDSDLPLSWRKLKLTSLILGGRYPTIPDFINYVTTLNTLYIGVNDTWGNFSDLVNLVDVTLSGNNATQPPDLPTWILNTQLLKIFTSDDCFSLSTTKQADIDTFIDNWYNFIVANADITGTNSTNYRNMIIRIRKTQPPPYDQPIPSGTFTAPPGYVQGVSNGTPAIGDSLAKVWVMTNQYSHTWYYRTT